MVACVVAGEEMRRFWGAGWFAGWWPEFLSIKWGRGWWPGNGLDFGGGFGMIAGMMAMRKRTAVLGWLLILGLMGSAEAGWRVGFAKATITPEEPVFMSGYASRDHASEGVETEIWVKVLVLRDEAGHEGMLVTTDLIGFRGDVARPVCERIMEATGLERAQILLNSSHTHTGPAISQQSVIAGNMTAEDAAGVVAYTKWFSDRVVETAVAAYQAETEAVELSYGVGVAPFVMNRREQTDGGIKLGVNPRGPADRSVPVLKVAKAGGGETVAVVFQCAAHNTTLGGKFYRITGDYAGYAQARVEEALPGVDAMFMLGCAGDANPYPRGTLEIAQAHGAVLGAEVLRVLEEGKLAPVGGPLETSFVEVDLPLAPMLSEGECRKMLMSGGGWRKYVAGTWLKMHQEGVAGPEVYRAPFGYWKFGNDLSLVGLPGEVVVDYAHFIERAFGREHRLWIAAYCNDVFGYLPSARVLREGGYETRGVYTGVGLFTPEVEGVVMETVEQLRAGK
jgi:neutral ceramidase